MATINFIKDIIDWLKKHKLTISLCESVTGGMIMSHLIDIPNASEVVKGGIVSYQDEIKIKNVGVNKNTIMKFGVVSPQTAKEMTEGIANKFRSDIALSITGHAGPKINDDKKCGIAFVCIKIIDKLFNFELFSKEKERNHIRIDFTLQTFNILYKVLRDMDK